MTGQRPTCPVCDRPCGTEADVYRHLLTGHRKQALAQVLAGEEPPAPTA